MRGKCAVHFLSAEEEAAAGPATAGGYLGCTGVTLSHAAGKHIWLEAHCHTQDKLGVRGEGRRICLRVGERMEESERELQKFK